MPNEDDRFSDVAEQLKQTEGGENGEYDDSENIDNPSSGSTAGESEGNAESAIDQTESEEESEDGPAFSFDETDMHGFYVREETWDQITQMRSSVTAACSMFNVSEFEGREFQDACLRVIADHGDEVALQILREREIKADEEQLHDVIKMLSDQAVDS